MSNITGETLAAKCKELGIDFRDVKVIDRIIALNVCNSNVYIFMSINFDIIGIEVLDNSKVEEVCRQKAALYNEKLTIPYLNGLSLADISEINNRVRFMRYDKIQVNNYFYPLPDDSEIVKMLGLLKFVNLEMNMYFRNIYPLMLAGCEVKYDVLEFIKGVLGKIWDLVQARPNIKISVILDRIGQNNSVNISRYLEYVVRLFKTPLDKDYFNQMLKILDFPYDEEKAINDSYKLFSKMPIRSFNELVQDLESNKPQR